MDLQFTWVRSIKVHWPVSSESMGRLASGDEGPFTDDAGLRSLCDVLAAFPRLGDFQNYQHVFEAGLGFEGFTVAPGARPTLGLVGHRTVSPTVTVKTYLAADEDEAGINAALSAILSAHPWEVPVVELSEPFRIPAVRTPAGQGAELERSLIGTRGTAL